MRPNALSLGERLKTTREHDIEEQRRIEVMEKAKIDETARKNLAAVTDFFNEARSRFTDRIVSNKDSGNVKLGDGSHNKAAEVLETFRWNDSRSSIESKNHPYHFVWEDFVEWANANGLQPKLAYCDDGYGKTYWYHLTVNPVN